MSIEELFKAVIVALEANTKAVVALEASLQGRTPSKSAKPTKEEEAKAIKVEEKVPSEKPEKAINQDDVEIPDSVTSYETLRELVLKLAGSGKREKIKAVSAKHGITAPKDLLKDPADMTSVTDQAKLEAVYADLKVLEA